MSLLKDIFDPKININDYLSLNYCIHTQIAPSVLLVYKQKGTFHKKIKYK